MGCERVSREEGARRRPGVEGETPKPTNNKCERSSVEMLDLYARNLRMGSAEKRVEHEGHQKERRRCRKEAFEIGGQKEKGGTEV